MPANPSAVTQGPTKLKASRVLAISNVVLRHTAQNDARLNWLCRRIARAPAADESEAGVDLLACAWDKAVADFPHEAIEIIDFSSPVRALG